MTLLLILPLVCLLWFIQNMAFTAVSRSRNSRDVGHHRRISWCSNGIWYFSQMLLAGTAFKAVIEGNWFVATVIGVFYTLSTSEGSVFMLKLMIGDFEGFLRKLDRIDDLVVDRWGIVIPEGLFLALSYTAARLDQFVDKYLVERGKAKVGA